MDQFTWTGSFVLRLQYFHCRKFSSVGLNLGEREYQDALGDLQYLATDVSHCILNIMLLKDKEVGEEMWCKKHSRPQ